MVLFNTLLTVIDCVLAPVLQSQLEPPAAVSTVEPPGQTLSTPVMIAVGPKDTLTVAEAGGLAQPLPLTITVYVVVELGLTVMLGVVAPVLQRNVVPPPAVRVVL